eukprot:scaffold15301_cov142-Cylindrotheca_fusiformis.AAC.6
MTSLDDQTNPVFDHQRFRTATPLLFPGDGFNQESGNLDVNKEKENLDRYLAASMGKLSVKDRETALEEVHGIVKNDLENMFFLEASLQAMEDRLNSIKRGTVYEKAEAIDPYFVSSREIRLLFLRGNRYDPQAGAEQLIKHFDLKLSLFGSEKLTKDITLLDLDGNDRICLASGFCQILPQKDVAGRTILLILPGLRPNLAMKHAVRAIYYLVMTTLQESEEVQMKGIVKISYAVGRYKNRKKAAGFAQVAQYMSSTPFRLRGIHMCFEERDYEEYAYRRAIILVLPTSVAAKTRTHFGSYTECVYALRGYGITDGSLPISLIDANPLLHNHMTWYEHRRIVDLGPVKPNEFSPAHKALLGTQYSEKSDVTNAMVCSSLTRRIEPRSGDILVSRLKDYPLRVYSNMAQLFQVWSGASGPSRYEAIDGKKEKMEFAQNLVRQMKASGSRFLMFDENIEAWTDVSDRMARNKVAKTLRNSRRSNGIIEARKR